jgi:hypothetical protein
MALKSGTEEFDETTLRVPRLPLAPHLLFFLIYNALYLTPLILVYLWGFAEGGTEELAGVSSSVMLRVASVYAAGTLAFFAGSSTHGFLRWAMVGGKRERWQPQQPQIGMSETLAVLAAVAIFIVSKIALIPLGVYHTYTVEMMTGGPWSFSAFCSETMVLMQVLVLFSHLRHRVSLFLGLSVINAINLLHGTRVFFIISAMTAVYYFYIQGKLKLKRVLLLGPPAFVAILFATYAVYLSRMSSYATSINAAELVSPLIYESVFSQLSIIGVVSHTNLWVITGRIGEFLQDVVLFTTPRIIIPDKDSLLFIQRFDYLSPKGAFNGYATAVLYFGIFFPLFYYIIGVIADWLRRWSQRNAWVFVLYVYLSTDFLLHIMRDGLLIPIKMLINAVQILILLALARWLFSLLSMRPSGESPATGGLAGII